MATDPMTRQDGHAIFAGPGEVRARCREVDWSTTPLGAVAGWPATLRTAVRLMFETPVATCLWCGPSYTLIYNDAYRRILGVKHPRALGRPGAQVWDELWPQLEEQFAAVRAGSPPIYVDQVLLTMERLEGGRAEDAWFTYSLSALRDEGPDGAPGECLAVYNLGIENTARVRAERAIAFERARLEEVFRRAPSFIVAMRDADLVYEFVNEAYYQLVGHREILGKPLLDALPEIRGQGFDTLLNHVRESGEPWVGRETPVELQRTPGAPLETRYLDMVFQALSDSEGTRYGVVAHGSDVTEQVLARREVERLLAETERLLAESESARADAEAANRAKSDFLATMSHELRTPLNAIGGYAELMEMGIRGPVTQQQSEDLRRIQASQLHLLRLVNEVLNYARIETGTVHYDLADVPLAAVIASVEPLVAPQLAAKGLAFVVTPCLPTPVARADREKLRQVLLNLLSNAVKFTDRGGRVEVFCGAEDGRVAVSVRDTGIGIATEELTRVFEPFVQVNASLTRTHEGTGLGLAISRDLARGMGGDLVAESVAGAGSTFTVTLPRADR
ncbi:MAG TPA: PAS domain-containing sensor histidine kinase [Gemmatimonadaceae bacterium]|nr:PAS domain-containing sensor histidine kinase [Gemmatimonadaceae bacterium]